jgi:hypothetical protein
MKNIKKFLPVIILVLVIIIPVFVNAQIIPNCGQTDASQPGGINKECGYADLLQLINNVINWIIMISVPVAAGVFAWAGILYMTTGISDKKSAAKKMMQNVFFGFVFILAAWIIVGAIVKALLANPGTVPVQLNINKSINLYA